MKSQIIKLVALMALLAGGFTISAQNTKQVRLSRLTVTSFRLR